VDFRRQAEVEQWVRDHKPEAVFVAAATVGGIEVNRTQPATFLYDNLMIAANIIHAAADAGVSRLMYLGSSCFYPRLSPQPIPEQALLTGPLEPTNESYAVAKIAGAKLCEAYRRQHERDYITAVPTSIYGPNDNFDPESSHVIPALIRKVHEAKIGSGGPVDIWGTGMPQREFLYVDDAADALVFLMEHYSGDGVVNVSGGEEVSIHRLAEIVAEVTGYGGGFRYDPSRPDGMPRKALTAAWLKAAGWQAATSLKSGITKTYGWFLSHFRA
jgi:GDP-L-fucose synthase